MGAPKGNQFWRQRSKHGRELLFSSPDLLRQAVAEYFQFVDDNPWRSVEAKVVNKAIKKVKIPKPIPYTLTGLYLYLGCSQTWAMNFKARLPDIKELDEETKKDFLRVFDEIEQIMYTQKFSGAAAGFFNANIIARELGLADKQEVKANVFDSDTPIEFK